MNFINYSSLNHLLKKHLFIRFNRKEVNHFENSQNKDIRWNPLLACNPA